MRKMNIQNKWEAAFAIGKIYVQNKWGEGVRGRVGVGGGGGGGGEWRGATFAT